MIDDHPSDTMLGAPASILIPAPNPVSAPVRRARVARRHKAKTRYLAGLSYEQLVAHVDALLAGAIEPDSASPVALAQARLASGASVLSESRPDQAVAHATPEVGTGEPCYAGHA